VVRGTAAAFLPIFCKLKWDAIVDFLSWPEESFIRSNQDSESTMKFTKVKVVHC
jgi:hypothetical protein